MTGISLDGVASWIVAAILGLGILWGIGEGLLRTQYTLGDVTVPMEDLGLGIFLVAILLGAFYFMKDVLRKI